MQVKFIKNGKTLTLYVFGELDECSSSIAKEILDKVLIDNLGCSKVIFNLSGLSFMDSTGVGLLIGRYKKLKKLGIKGYISNPSFQIDKILQISGIYDIMPKYKRG